MTVYADYTYYTTTYLGTLIASADFSALALRASAQVDQITYNRAAAEVEVGTVDKIKMAMCAIADELQRQDSAGGADGITSEGVGTYKVSYRRGSYKTSSNQERIENAGKLYLASTFLLFPGFNAGEYGGGYTDNDL